MMNSHFSPKSLAFYTGMITFVTILFSLVTAYGEANLKAPYQIDGRYSLVAEQLPNCFQTEAVDLRIQQSGIFLTGAISPKTASEQAVRIAQERPLLSGRWVNNQLTLEGKAGAEFTCQGSVKITGAIAQDTLTGEISLSSAPDVIPFSATREVPATNEAKQH